MDGEQIRSGFNSRYIVQTMLGEFPPWHGFKVSDSLSEKEYLLFSRELPASRAPSTSVSAFLSAS